MGRGRSVSGWEGLPNKTETGRKLYNVVHSSVFTHPELNISNPPLKKKDNLYK